MALARPRGFPDEFWLPVLGAEATARARLLAALDDVPWQHVRSARFLQWDLVKKGVGEYLTAVVEAFADQGCLAVRAGRFSAMKLDSAVEDFVERAMRHAYRGLGHEKIQDTWHGRGTDIRELRTIVMKAPWHMRYLASLAEVLAARGVSAPQASDPVTTKAAQRRAVVERLLNAQGLSVPQWAVRAGVNQTVAYDYLSGKTDPRPSNRRALAEALNLQTEQLPN